MTKRLLALLASAALLGACNDATGVPDLNNVSAETLAAVLQAVVDENYSTAAGETQNARVDAALHLNQAVADSILPGDLRAVKIVKAASPYTISTNGANIATQYDFYQSLGSASLTAALLILKNEQ